MLNKVQLIGRLGQDPQLRFTQSGSPIANFSVATDESFTDREGNRQEKTEWHRVVAFQKTAENCKLYLHKGSLVYVEGSLQTRKWQDPQGNDRYTTEVRALRVVFLDRRQSAQEAEMGQGQRSYQPRGEAFPQNEYGAGYKQAQAQGFQGNDNYGQTDSYAAQNGSYDRGDEGSPFVQDAVGEAIDPVQQGGGESQEQTGEQPTAGTEAVPSENAEQDKSKLDEVPF